MPTVQQQRGQSAGDFERSGDGDLLSVERRLAPLSRALELQDGNTLSGAIQVACDDSAVLIGNGSNVKTSRRKTK